MPAALHNGAYACDDAADEYEFEYDATATDEFYFLLDLSAHVPSAPSDGPAAAEKPAPPHHENSNDSDRNHAAHPVAPVPSPSVPSSSSSVGDLQILDLHTRNPIVKYANHIYSCYWSTDLGTQFHIAKAGAVSNPRRAGNVLDVIATSQTRLLGRPVTLQRRGEAARTAPYTQFHTEGDQPRTAITVSDDDDDGDGEEPDVHDPHNEEAPLIGPSDASESTFTVPNSVASDALEPTSTVSNPGVSRPEPAEIPVPAPTSIPDASGLEPVETPVPARTQPLDIPRHLIKTKTGAEHADFLEALSRIKHQRQEYDPVPIYSAKSYEPPSPRTQAAMRARALELDDLQAQQLREEHLATLAERPPRKRRRRARRQMDDADVRGQQEVVGQDGGRGVGGLLEGLRADTAKYGGRGGGVPGRKTMEVVRESLGYEGRGREEGEGRVDELRGGRGDEVAEGRVDELRGLREDEVGEGRVEELEEET